MNFKEQVEAYVSSGKKVLTLIIKNQYFDDIMAGTKKQESREIKPSTERKYILFDQDGYPIEDENGNTVPIQYDALLLYAGYQSNRQAALVGVESAETALYIDDNNEPIFYFIDKYTRKEVFPHYYDEDTLEALDENNNVIENYEAYFREEITYHLGKVIAAKLNR
ncbi:MAG: hypothetical protein IKX59_06405 [Bacteroidales bacterium]|nr:hypothetical protein [Bacteroidales bacterium]